MNIIMNMLMKRNKINGWKSFKNLVLNKIMMVNILLRKQISINLLKVF